MKEIWKDIPGWEGYYQASNKGRVKSLDRVVETKTGPRKYKGKMKKLCNNLDGYLNTTLTKNKIHKMYGVHRLMGLAFWGKKCEKMMVCHKDGSKTNNTLSNLRIDTCQGNLADRVRHGTMIYGERNGKSVLTKDIVYLIKYGYHKMRWNYVDIAKILKIKRYLVGQVIRGYTWRHIKI